MAIKIITPPAIEPVTLQELKDHLRIVHDDEDTILATYLKAARMYAETTLCWRAFIEQELELVKDWFLPMFKLPRPPLQSVTSITYTDHEGNVETVDAADYIVDTDSEPARIVPAYGETWPSATLAPVNAVRVRFKAGYPTYQGTVNVANGEDDLFVNVSWVSGDKFDTDWQPEQRIIIGGSVYSIASITDDETLVIAEDAGKALTGVNYSVNLVPTEIKQGVLLMAAHFYENREPVVIGSIVTRIPFTVEVLLLPYRAWGGDT